MTSLAPAVSGAMGAPGTRPFGATLARARPCGSAAARVDRRDAGFGGRAAGAGRLGEPMNPNHHALRAHPPLRTEQSLVSEIPRRTSRDREVSAGRTWRYMRARRN